MIQTMHITEQMPVRSIAEALGVSIGTIHARMREYGIELIPAPVGLRLDREAVRREYIEGGLTLSDVAKKFGCSRGCIRKMAVKGKFLRPREKNEVVAMESKKFTLTADQLREMYIDREMSDVSIGSRIGCCNVTVASWRRKFGIKRAPLANMVHLNVEDLRRMYIDEKMTMELIAKHFECGESTVRAHIIRVGLNIDSVEVAARRLADNATRYSREFINQGYRRIRVANHPGANRDGYVTEHRYVAECAMGRYLEFGELVHHINFKKLDNRIENLAVLSSKEDHMLAHAYMERLGAYLCGVGGDRPEPLVFSKPSFWGGSWVTEIDLLKSTKGDAVASAAIH